jgi:hypothetical protein
MRTVKVLILLIMACFAYQTWAAWNYRAERDTARAEVTRLRAVLYGPLAASGSTTSAISLGITSLNGMASVSTGDSLVRNSWCECFTAPNLNGTGPTNRPHVSAKALRARGEDLVAP